MYVYMYIYIYICVCVYMYIYIFAHDWHLSICQCKEACPSVSFIKNDKSPCSTFTGFLVVYFGLFVLELVVKAYSSSTNILYVVLFPAPGQFIMVFKNKNPLELALYMTTYFLCMCLCDLRCACGSFNTSISYNVYFSIVYEIPLNLDYSLLMQTYLPYLDRSIRLSLIVYISV